MRENHDICLRCYSICHKIIITPNFADLIFTVTGSSVVEEIKRSEKIKMNQATKNNCEFLMQIRAKKMLLRVLAVIYSQQAFFNSCEKSIFRDFKNNRSSHAGELNQTE